jgi:hypothetical protein
LRERVIGARSAGTELSHGAEDRRHEAPQSETTATRQARDDGNHRVMARVLMDRHQESDMAPKPRRETQDVPDSLPKRDEGTDVMPDKVRRTDPSQTILPDSLPPTDDQPVEQADGGLAQHPIHDDDLEDRDPEDFEREINDVQAADPRP